MKILKTIDCPLSSGEIKSIIFAHPATKKEFEMMFKFRHDSYLRHNYIKKGYFKDGLDKDEYDTSNKCIYFVAFVENKIVGSVRIIIDDPLPTEKDCFDFKEPNVIKDISRKKRGEVSRLIVEKFGENLFFPRHVILLGLVSCIIDYSLSNDLDGGYGFIKDKLKKKLDKIKIPIGFIKKFKQKYNQKLLHNYFNDPKDPVWPIYYVAKDADIFLQLVFKYFLKKIDNNHYKYEGASILKKIMFYIKINFLSN